MPGTTGAAETLPAWDSRVVVAAWPSKDCRRHPRLHGQPACSTGGRRGGRGSGRGGVAAASWKSVAVASWRVGRWPRRRGVQGGGRGGAAVATGEGEAAPVTCGCGRAGMVATGQQGAGEATSWAGGAGAREGPSGVIRVRVCIWATWNGPNWAKFGMSSVLRLTEPRNRNRTESFGS